MTAGRLMQAGQVWVSYSMPACRVLGQCKLHHVLYWAGQLSLEPQLVPLCRSLCSHADGSCRFTA